MAVIVPTVADDKWLETSRFSTDENLGGFFYVRRGAMAPKGAGKGEKRSGRGPRNVK